MLIREHESFDAGVSFGIMVSLFGGLSLALSVDFVLSMAGLPEPVAEFLRWSWP